jgi:exonuclease VII small subunit
MATVADGVTSATSLTYAQRMTEVEALTQKLQCTEDVDEIVRLYEAGSALLEACEAQLRETMGRFEVLQPSTES